MGALSGLSRPKGATTMLINSNLVLMVCQGGDGFIGFKGYLGLTPNNILHQFPVKVYVYEDGTQEALKRPVPLKTQLRRTLGDIEAHINSLRAEDFYSALSALRRRGGDTKELNSFFSSPNSILKDISSKGVVSFDASLESVEKVSGFLHSAVKSGVAQYLGVVRSYMEWLRFLDNAKRAIIRKMEQKVEEEKEVKDAKRSKEESFRSTKKRLWENLAGLWFTYPVVAFWTLTFNPERLEEKGIDGSNRDVVVKLLSKFEVALKKKFEGVAIVAVLEKHKNGRYHIHCVIGSQDIIKKDDLEKIWGWGFTFVKPVVSVEGLFDYLVKYLAKDFEGLYGSHKRKFFASHHLKDIWKKERLYVPVKSVKKMVQKVSFHVGTITSKEEFNTAFNKVHGEVDRIRGEIEELKSFLREEIKLHIVKLVKERFPHIERFWIYRLDVEVDYTLITKGETWDFVVTDVSVYFYGGTKEPVLWDVLYKHVESLKKAGFTKEANRLLKSAKRVWRRVELIEVDKVDFSLIEGGIVESSSDCSSPEDDNLDLLDIPF